MLYINTSVEVWDPYDRDAVLAPDPADAVLAAHERPPDDRPSWREPGPTAVLEHGANPGLISHFTKQALIDIGERLLDDRKVDRAGRPRNSGN